METLNALDPIITKHDAQLILGAAGDTRYNTLLSGFTGPLTVAMFKADTGNLARLGKGFPGLVAAKIAYSHTSNGHALLCALASGQTLPAERTDIENCTCVFSCADDPATACSLSGGFHVHAGDPCPLHPEAPGDR